MKERLQKYIARCGAASRRGAEEMIFSGRIKVNGVRVDKIVLVDEKDVIELDGRIIKPEKKEVYLVLNKPIGIITSSNDQFGRRTVLDMIDIKERVYPVGRLDYDTSGLLILTNDGDAANRIMHPSRKIDKVYIAEVLGVPGKEELDSFKGGLKIEDYVTSHAGIRVIETKKNRSTLEITIHEGKNRQVRKMCEAIGHPVIGLKRVAEGEIILGNLKEGQWRYMTDKEIEYIKSI